MRSPTSGTAYPTCASRHATTGRGRSAKSAARAPNKAFDYGDPVGEARLRLVTAAYLRRVRAIAATAEQVVICTGMAQALGLLLRVLAADGIDTLAVEDPGAGTSTTQQALAAGMTVARVPVDAHGIDVAELERTSARAALVTPAHQWPTGVTGTAGTAMDTADERFLLEFG